MLPWEINSIGVNTNDRDAHCEVGVAQGGNVCVYMCTVCLFFSGSLICFFTLFSIHLYISDNHAGSGYHNWLSIPFIVIAQIPIVCEVQVYQRHICNNEIYVKIYVYFLT